MISDEGNWKYLPDLILEKILSYLSWRDRLNVACTCKLWCQVFYNPILWKTFSYRNPKYLRTHNAQIYYDLTTWSLSRFFNNFGYCFHNLLIPPISDYFMLHRLLSVISNYYSRSKYSNFENIDPFNDRFCKLTNFYFEFDSQIENSAIYGTGGNILKDIKSVLDILRNLKVFRLKSLLLSPQDREGLLFEFIESNKNTIINLSLLDSTKIPRIEYDCLHFINLEQLEISPYQIDGDMLINLIQETKLRKLILTQTKFTLFTDEYATIEPIDNFIWSMANELQPQLQVYQQYLLDNIPEFNTMDNIPEGLLYQPSNCPVNGFAVSTNNQSLVDLNRIGLYHHSLTRLVIIFNNHALDSNTLLFPIDEELIDLSNHLIHLHTLVLGGNRISVNSSTLLHIIQQHSNHIHNLFVQSDCVNFKSILTDFTFTSDLIDNSSNRESFIYSISKLIRSPKWTLLDTEDFFRIVRFKTFLF